MTANTLVLSATDVARLLDIRDCIDAIARTLCAHEAGQTRGPVSGGFALPEGSFHAKAAAVETEGRVFVAVKANINLPGNPTRRNRPTIQGALILLDGDTGQPLAVMDSIALTSVRTAAVAALAAQHLSLASTHTITIVGCGEQGESQLRAMCKVRESQTAFAVDADAAKAVAFARRLSDQLGLRVDPTMNLAAAIGAWCAGGLRRSAAYGRDAEDNVTDLVLYFLKLGSIGFGGPAALVGYMRRDLVEDRQLIDESTYNLSIALAQIMPGPLAAQTAMAISYFQGGVMGASLVGLAFILPSFLMVLVLSVAYVAYGGMSWMQAVFYGVGAVIIAIIAMAAYRLARGTNKLDPLLWAIFAGTFAATVWTGSELAVIFILSGLAVLVIRAWPGRRLGTAIVITGLGIALAIGWLELALSGVGAAREQPVLLQILLFFGKAGSFVFGSGLAIVPFLQQGVVHDFGWLSQQQFLDAVAVALITPGPVVITVAFIGYLVAGIAGAVLAGVGIFLPVYVFTVVPAPWFARHRHNTQLRAFATGATSAASGAIASAVVVLGSQAIVDVATASIAIGGLLLLVRVRAAEPLLVVGAGLAGLALSR